MEVKKIIVEKKEFAVINELIRNIQDSENLNNKCISKLKAELKTAVIVEDADFPSDVIRLNSIVDIETPFGQMKAQLVLPENSNTTQKRISILTPMGSALLGYAVGDELLWDFPNGEKQIKIVQVTQG